MAALFSAAASARVGQCRVCRALRKPLRPPGAGTVGRRCVYKRPRADVKALRTSGNWCTSLCPAPSTRSSCADAASTLHSVSLWWMPDQFVLVAVDQHHRARAAWRRAPACAADSAAPAAAPRDRARRPAPACCCKARPAASGRARAVRAQLRRQARGQAGAQRLARDHHPLACVLRREVLSTRRARRRAAAPRSRSGRCSCRSRGSRTSPRRSSACAEGVEVDEPLLQVAGVAVQEEDHAARVRAASAAPPTAARRARRRRIRARRGRCRSARRRAAGPARTAGVPAGTRASRSRRRRSRRAASRTRGGEDRVDHVASSAHHVSECVWHGGPSPRSAWPDGRSCPLAASRRGIVPVCGIADSLLALDRPFGLPCHGVFGRHGRLSAPPGDLRRRLRGARTGRTAWAAAARQRRSRYRRAGARARPRPARRPSRR